MRSFTYRWHGKYGDDWEGIELLCSESFASALPKERITVANDYGPTIMDDIYGLDVTGAWDIHAWDYEYSGRDYVGYDLRLLGNFIRIIMARSKGIVKYLRLYRAMQIYYELR